MTSNQLPPTLETWIYRRIESYRAPEDPVELSSSRTAWKRRHMRWDPVKERLSMHQGENISDPPVWAIDIAQLDSIRRVRDTILSDIKFQSSLEMVADPETPTIIEKAGLFVNDIASRFKFSGSESRVAILHVKMDQGYDQVHIAARDEKTLGRWVTTFDKILNERWYRNVERNVEFQMVKRDLPVFKVEDLEESSPRFYETMPREYSATARTSRNSAFLVPSSPLPNVPTDTAKVNLRIETQYLEPPSAQSPRLSARSIYKISTPVDDVTVNVNVAIPYKEYASSMLASALFPANAYESDAYSMDGTDIIPISPPSFMAIESTPLMSPVDETKPSKRYTMGVQRMSRELDQMMISMLKADLTRPPPLETVRPLVSERSFGDLIKINEHSELFVALLELERDIGESMKIWQETDSSEIEIQIGLEICRDIISRIAPAEQSVMAYLDKVTIPHVKRDTVDDMEDPAHMKSMADLAFGSLHESIWKLNQLQLAIEDNLLAVNEKRIREVINAHCELKLAVEHVRCICRLYYAVENQ